MLSGWCQTATQIEKGALALLTEKDGDGSAWSGRYGSAARLHARCGDAIRGCTCACHGQTADAPQEPPETPKTAPKRAKRGGNGQCEHCGAPTGGRFAPGHDAKLKSELLSAAREQQGEAAIEALAELILRGWIKFWRGSMDPAFQRHAERIVQLHPEIVGQRNAARQGRFQGSSSNG